MLYYDGKYGWENVIKNRIGASTVFAFYLGGSFTIGKVLNSPLRKDQNPSFSIFEGKEELMYKDFATGDSGNCIKFVMEIFKISRSNAIIKILVDLFRSNLSDLGSTVVCTTAHAPRNVVIGLKTTDFQQSDLDYWKKYNIYPEILSMYDVQCCTHVWVDDKIVWVRSDKEPIYAYLTNNHIKVYRPKSKKAYKWGGNTTMEDVFGLKQLKSSDTLIITKSAKDVMVLRSLGIESVSPNSETALIPEDIINDLKSKYKNIYVLMDNDAAGKKAGARYHSTYGLKDIYLPTKEKDISDYIETHTVFDANALIKSIL